MMEDHLSKRKVTDLRAMTITEKFVYFWLYNLSQKIVGNQRYDPTGIKQLNSASKKSKEPLKYKQSVVEGELAVYGLHTYDKDSKYLFLVEGVFDCKMLHQAGLPAIATLSNDPKPLQSWLRTLPQILVVISDNDDGGKKLRKFGDIVFICEGAKDLNDMTIDQLDRFLAGVKKKLGL